jgi:hypothetical protein
MIRFKIITLAVTMACIAMMANAAVNIECNRECLSGFMTTYLNALSTHDALKLPVTKNVKYTENGVRLNLTDGLWHTVVGMPTYRVDVIDELSGTVGLLGIINENGNKNWFATRLKVEKGKQVSEIENLVVRNIMGGAPADSPVQGKVYTEPHPLMMEVIPLEKRLPRAELASIGNSYFTGLDTDNDGKYVPFDPACQRRENGMITSNNPDAPKGSMQWMNCKDQFDTHFSVIVTKIRERRFAVVDPVTGLVFAFGYFDHDGSVEKMSVTLDGKLIDVDKSMRQPFSFYIGEISRLRTARSGRLKRR